MIFGSIKRIVKTLFLITLIVGITHVYYEIRVEGNLDQISEKYEEFAEDQLSGQANDDLVAFTSEIIDQLLESIESMISKLKVSPNNNQNPQPERS